MVELQRVRESFTIERVDKSVDGGGEEIERGGGEREKGERRD